MRLGQRTHQLLDRRLDHSHELASACSRVGSVARRSRSDGGKAWPPTDDDLDHQLLVRLDKVLEHPRRRRPGPRARRREQGPHQPPHALEAGPRRWHGAPGYSSPRADKRRLPPLGAQLGESPRRSAPGISAATAEALRPQPPDAGLLGLQQAMDCSCSRFSATMTDRLQSHMSATRCRCRHQERTSCRTVCEGVSLSARTRPAILNLPGGEPARPL